MTTRVILIFILSKTYPNNVIQITHKHIKSLLFKEKDITSSQIDKLEIEVVQHLNGNLYQLTYLDCLEYVFFDNCLWHKNFKFLINIGKSILIK